MPQVITRFAPSPTGFLHIGGARTALFNWLYARHHGGQFRLRIEDTDKERSTQAAKDAILHGLNWLGLEHDGEIVYQSARAERHRAAALDLLQKGRAYKCFCTPAELDAMREDAKAAGRPVAYDRRWRDVPAHQHPLDKAYVIRLKMPLEGATTLHDAIQGEVTVAHTQLDDMVLLRADGSPTYMLAVVVDDHDMGVTHVIRGDDHLNNAFRQVQLIRAFGWPEPVYAHIPLIHGADGAKLSKRHGALGVEAYREMGYLPEAMTNYLLRLGWSHGDDDIITRQQAIAWFDLPAVGKAPARFDMDKLNHINGVYLKAMPVADALQRLLPALTATYPAAEAKAYQWLEHGLPGLLERATVLPDVVAMARFYLAPHPLPFTDAALLEWDKARVTLPDLITHLEKASADWTEAGIKATLQDYADRYNLKMGKVAMPIRLALTGDTASPSVFAMMAIFGREEVLRRLHAVLP